LVDTHDNTLPRVSALHERLPKELRELAGNPFVLPAIVRSVDRRPRNPLPAARIPLLSGFVLDGA
jgi:hypothetical protein